MKKDKVINKYGYLAPKMLELGSFIFYIAWLIFFLAWGGIYYLYFKEKD